MAALKTVLWIFFSLLIHLILGTVLWTAGLSEYNSVPDQIVDLTLTSPDSGVRGNHQRVKPAKKLKSVSPSTTTTESLSSQATTPANSEQTEGSTQPGDSEVSPADWSEVTKFPKVVKEFKSQYPAEAKKAGVDGPVVLDVLIDAKGKVRKVTIVKGPGYGLNESAIEALKQFEFFPAQKGANSVAVKIRYTYRFKLGVN